MVVEAFAAMENVKVRHESHANGDVKHAILRFN